MVSVILHFILERRFIMEETSKTVPHELLSHSDLLDLYKHSWSVLLAELGFCHQYLNFYSGLLSALLAATLAGLLSIKFGGLRELLLLLGPALIFVLAWNGYKTVETFYRRFAEAWVTIINLESMLHIRYAPQPIELGYQPLYISTEKSFIPTYYWPEIKEIFDKAKKKRWEAERLAEELGKKGTTLVNAKITFGAFGVAATILSVFIALTTAYPSLF